MSPSLNKEFGEFISKGVDLTDVLDWISEKIENRYISLGQIVSDFEPDDIFSNRELSDWAEENNYYEGPEKELDDFSDDKIKEYVLGEFGPEDIYSTDVLSAWAEGSGFIHEDDV